MDKKKLTKPSKNFIDKTGHTERDRLVDTLLGVLNPKSAYHNIRGTLIENGAITPPAEKRIIPRLMMDKAPQSSGNFIDRTGVPASEKGDIQKMLLLDLLKRAQRGYMLHTPDNRLMAVDPILNIAHDPLKRGLNPYR